MVSARCWSVRNTTRLGLRIEVALGRFLRINWQPRPRECSKLSDNKNHADTTSSQHSFVSSRESRFSNRSVFSVDRSLSLTPCFSWVLTTPQGAQPLPRFFVSERLNR